jgi:predicted RNase H-like nuclease (RuvC/YqgF family)
MSSDKIERQMAFIVEQQARFAEDITRQEKQSRENTVNIAKLADVILSLTNVVQRHDDALGRVDRQIEELARESREAVERGKEIDARLNTLINVVEQHISKHNGKQ